MGNILTSLEDYKRGRLRYFSIPPNLQFGQASEYDLEKQQALEDILMLRGQRVNKVHDNGIEFGNQSVLSSRYVQNRHRKIRARENYEQRIRDGAPATGALGIVGNNFCKRNTLAHKKETRAALFNVQNMLQKLRIAGEPIVSDSTCDCGKPLGPRVQVQQSVEHGSASINQIQTCGSVWECPVCRNKIISDRSEELSELYNEWKDRGGHCFMLTLTAPHAKTDNLAELYGSCENGTGLSGALKRFRASKHFSKAFKEVSGYFGDVRGVEVTWGRSNGFHPHIHILIFAEYSFCFKTWKNRFYEAWRGACLKSGLKEPSYEHGVDISYCSDEGGATYLAKWSAASEVSSGNKKKAKSGNFSIAELERCTWDKAYRNERKIGLNKVARILKSYYASMRGQRMLQTGGISKDRNWKAELIGQNESKSENHRPICDLDYRLYCRIKRKDQLNELLEAAEFSQKQWRPPIDRIKSWLHKNGYDPAGVQKPSINSPPTESGYSLSRKIDIPPEALECVSRPKYSA